jgi:hypothetical protein
MRNSKKQVGSASGEGLSRGVKIVAAVVVLGAREVSIQPEHHLLYRMLNSASNTRRKLARRVRARSCRGRAYPAGSSASAPSATNHRCG